MKHIFILTVTISFLFGCLLPEEPSVPSLRTARTTELQVAGITKWYNGHRSAYTPTYDSPNLDGPEVAWLLREGLFIDFEVISELYDHQRGKMDTLKNLLVPAGFGYFGHGHTHIDHDKLDSAAAYASFRKNFEIMAAAGLKPVSYAYPGGYGFQPETHGALFAAGFLSGRLAWHWFDEPGRPAHIMPGDETQPRNWFMLPALAMQDSAFENCQPCVNNPREFAAHLHKSVEQKAWLITMYHAIGLDGKAGRPRGWGFYDRDNFYEEMRLAKSLRDQGLLWIASQDAVTLYTRERAATTWKLERKGPDLFELLLSNDLDKSRFDHPLTVVLSIPGALGRRLQVHRPGEEIPVADLPIDADSVLVDLVPSGRPYRLTVL